MLDIAILLVNLYFTYLIEFSNFGRNSWIFCLIPNLQIVFDLEIMIQDFFSFLPIPYLLAVEVKSFYLALILPDLELSSLFDFNKVLYLFVFIDPLIIQLIIKSTISSNGKYCECSDRIIFFL